MTAITISINAQTYSCKCPTEHQPDLSRPPLDPSKTCEKTNLNTNIYSLVYRNDLILLWKEDLKSSTELFKALRLMRTSFHQPEPISDQCWEACSFTGKAIMSAHRQKIACCANRFRASLQGTQCSSLYLRQYFFLWCLFAHQQDRLSENVIMLLCCFSHHLKTNVYSPNSPVCTTMIIVLYKVMQSSKTLTGWCFCAPL